MVTRDFPFFSGNALNVVGILLLLVILWAVYNLGATALERWFG